MWEITDDDLFTEQLATSGKSGKKKKKPDIFDDDFDLFGDLPSTSSKAKVMVLLAHQISNIENRQFILN